MMRTRVLLIYTGGTIGMNRNSITGALEPFDFGHLLANIPELRLFDTVIATYQFNPPIDSSDMSPERWTALAQVIADNYEQYNGLWCCMEQTPWPTRLLPFLLCWKTWQSLSYSPALSYP